MTILDLKDKMVAVLGYGQEGKATTKYLLKHGLKPVLFDHKPWEKWSKEEQDDLKALNVNFIFGPDCFKELAGFDVAFRSPGINLKQLTINNLPTGQAGLQLTSQTKFFFDNCPAKIVGVTGTKGKGTTATLISEILKLQCQNLNSKYQIYLTGNIGKEQPFEFLDNLNSDDFVVYELSSFQLQDLEKSPHIGVTLMVTQEHLDYHESVKEYHSAKEAITKFQTENDFSVYNLDYETSVKIGTLGSGKKYSFSRKQILESGCFLENEALVVKGINGKSFQLPISDFQLRGEHNLENIMAAVCVSVGVGIDEKVILETINNFKGLEHRLQFVLEKKGIKFYNDSFSTTPETAIAAIRSFSEPLVVILGGSSKNADFTELSGFLGTRQNVKAVILVGEEAGRIKQAINSARNFKGKILEGASSMEEIFGQIKSVATDGNVVLLSPACASFGMFKNYKERGEQFKNLAKSF